MFWNLFSIVFYQCLPWIGLLITLLLDISLEILLLGSVIGITTSSISLSLFGIAISFKTICSLCLLPEYGSPTSAFFFDKSTIFKSHLPNILALYFDSLMYSLLAIITCLICSAQMQKYYIVLRLYLIKICCQVSCLSNFDHFLSEMLHSARLLKIRTCYRS